MGRHELVRAPVNQESIDNPEGVVTASEKRPSCHLYLCPCPEIVWSGYLGNKLSRLLCLAL